MLEKLGVLRGVFSPKDIHPLLDARELRKTISELPKDNAFRALDEIVGWLESLQVVHEFSAERLFEAARQLDEAAQPHLKRLTKEYLHNIRLARADEHRLWSINHAFWALLAEAYERCIKVVQERGRGADALKPQIVDLCARNIVALGGLLKWDAFHYGPPCSRLWERLGAPLLLAEKLGLAERAGAGLGTPKDEYLRVMLFQIASMDSLLPLEIDLAERIIAHFLKGFHFAPEVMEDSVYWVDLALDQAPQRLFKMPEPLATSQRFCKPGSGHAAIVALLTELEQGGDVPAALNLGGQYYARTVLPVLRHLSLHLAPVPPQREHDRHHVKHRMAVLNGLNNAFAVFPGDSATRTTGLPVESWVVENVSRGGFGAVLNDIPGEWLKVGALLAMQPQGGDNWVLGVVRRYFRETQSEARVGIQVLAHRVTAVELRPRMASSYAAVSGEPGLLIEGLSLAGEVHLVRAPASFDMHESLEYSHSGLRVRLTPVSVIEQTADYELACYRPGEAA